MMNCWCRENIFNVLCKNVPKFESKRQQDAVEALRYILDGIDMEASKRLKEKKGVNRMLWRPGRRNQ